MFDLNNFHQQVADFIYYLDDTTAKKFFKFLKKEDLDFIISDEDAKYDLISLKFLLIPFLPDKEVLNLLKENLKIGLYLNDIDIVERLKKRLMFIDLQDRDSAKEILRTALLANRESIIRKIEFAQDKNIITVNDWIKDYISFNNRGNDALSKARYLSGRLGVLDAKEKEILKKLLNLYDYIDTSSLAPSGFEDDLLIKDNNGKITTTKNGVVVVLYDPSKRQKVSDNTTTLTERSGDAISDSSKNINQSVNPVLSSTILELEPILKDYSPSSLEYKAISQEISRLKSAALKQAQRSAGTQSDVLK